MGSGTVLARATSDAQDRLVHAEEPLAGLQIRCGGQLPGTIAVPELLELVRKARRFGFRLARPIVAQDGVDLVRAWIEVDPREGAGEPSDSLEGEDQPRGCEIRVRAWQSTPIPVEDPGLTARRRIEIDRHLAALCARLDARQQVLAVVSQGPDLAALASAMEAGHGRVWTDFLPSENGIHDQSLHWRLLDGARVKVFGSPRSWRVALVPSIQPGFEPSGFELLMIADELAPPLSHVSDASAALPRRSRVGQEIAPVLKHPISRIIANAETIRTRLAGPLPDAYSQYAGEIASAGKLLLGLLDDMADLEVVESEGFTTAPDRIDLAEVARQAAGILNVRAREKNITVALPQSGESLGAVAEFRRVLQVLLNLIGNAIRYSPENSRIQVFLQQAGHRARVIVEDQGPGISAEQQLRIFEKFERLGRSGDGGTGLGLYISRQLAAAMGGSLSVESALGEGARFILEVPADRNS